jgi:hypothetical protein
MKIGDRVRFSTKYLIQCGASWSSYGLRGVITAITAESHRWTDDRRVSVRWDNRYSSVSYNLNQLILEEQSHMEILP